MTESNSVEQKSARLRVVASYGRLAGSARVRLFDWLDWLGLDADEFVYADVSRLRPAQILGSPFRAIRAERILRLLRRIGSSRLLISRRASPFSNGGVEEGLLRSAERGIYDFDDALWLDRHGPFPLADIWRRSVESADVVIAGNEMLAKEARQYSSHVVTIPSCVHPEKYVQKRDYGITSPVAGWIGTPATERYLTEISAPLLQLHAEYGLRVKLISAGEASLGPLARMVDRVNWRSETYVDELASVDFGIMPLDDTEWSRGKCAYKLLQYGAAAQISVASPIGANRLALDRMGGMKASDEGEWYEAVRRVLLMDPVERAERGRRARAAVQEYYSFAAWRATWMSVVLGSVETS